MELFVQRLHNAQAGFAACRQQQPLELRKNYAAQHAGQALTAKEEQHAHQEYAARRMLRSLGQTALHAQIMRNAAAVIVIGREKFALRAHQDSKPCY